MLKANLHGMMRARDKELTDMAESFRSKQCQSKGLALWALMLRVLKANRKRTLEDCLNVIDGGSIGRKYGNLPFVDHGKETRTCFFELLPLPKYA